MKGTKKDYEINLMGDEQKAKEIPEDIIACLKERPKRSLCSTAGKVGALKKWDEL